MYSLDVPKQLSPLFARYSYIVSLVVPFFFQDAELLRPRFRRGKTHPVTSREGAYIGHLILGANIRVGVPTSNRLSLGVL